jgi:ATPase family protein associated with various cellular activities (AAA)
VRDDSQQAQEGPPPWQVLADTLLQREALVCRLGEGLTPHDFAGLYVGHDEVARILDELPGLRGPRADEVAALTDRLAPEVTLARKQFVESLRGSCGFARIVRNALLDVADAEVLALVAAVDSSPHRQRLVAYVQDNVQLPRLTLASLVRMLADQPGPRTGVRCVAPDAPLCRAELVELIGEGPWATRMCAPTLRIAWSLTGDDAADPGLPAGSRLLGSPSPDKTPDPIAVPELLLVAGADAESRLAVVRRRWPGRPLVVCPLPASPVEWPPVIREAGVGGRAVVIELQTSLPRSAADRIDRANHLTWVLSSPGELALDTLPRRPWTEIRLESGLADAGDWADALATPPDPAYPLTRDQLLMVAAACGGDSERLGAGVRRLAGGHLDGLATRIRPARGWPDLVLPADQMAQLRELVSRYRRRTVVYRDWGFSPLPSTGLVAMFSGPSGTGKTLAAEIIAGELGLDLYKVDLSSVVSKYIGETEKNLERIFGAASAGDLVLFFDEADALFGKRSEVSDAHDRYANIEVAYLLQRLESYQGLVVMATNLQRNIDDAFLRRISVAVDFEPPDEPQRRRLWRQAIPASAPVGGLDFDFLARQFRVTGGTIRNAVLGAAFLAAGENGSVTMERIALAMKREFQKLGRLRTESEFGRYFDLVNSDPADGDR